MFSLNILIKIFIYFLKRGTRTLFHRVQPQIKLCTFVIQVLSLTPGASQKFWVYSTCLFYYILGFLPKTLTNFSLQNCNLSHLHQQANVSAIVLNLNKIPTVVKERTAYILLTLSGNLPSPCAVRPATVSQGHREGASMVCQHSVSHIYAIHIFCSYPTLVRTGICTLKANHTSTLSNIQSTFHFSCLVYLFSYFLRRYIGVMKNVH